MPNRARYRTVIETTDVTTGFRKPVPNPTITIYEPGTTTPIAQTIYAADTGGTTKANPFTGGADGSVEFYLNQHQQCDVRATGTGLGTITISYEPVHPALPFLMAYRVYPVRDYGAIGDGTPATAGINAATVAMLANTSQPGGILQFHAGDFPYDNTLNSNIGTYHQLQGKFGYVIRGVGMGATKWYPGVRADEWSGKVFISLAGALNCGIEDISIGIPAVAAQSFPYSFLFLAQNQTNGSNALWLKNVRIEGAAKHPLSNFAVPSCDVDNLHVYNHKCTHPDYDDDGNVSDGAPVALSRENLSGISAIAGYTLLNNTHTSGGNPWAARSMSDWDIKRWELHDLTSLAGTANASGLLLYQATNIRAKGNISSNGTLVKVPAAPAADAVMTDGIALEITGYVEGLGGASEGGIDPTGAVATPLYAVLFSNLFSHGTPSLNAGRINLTNSRLDIKAADSAAAVFKAEAGWTINRPTLRSWTPAAGFTGAVLDMVNNAGNILNYPDIDCVGLGVSVGAAGTINTEDGCLTNPGTITAGTLNWVSKVGAGSASLPAYSFYADPNTGMFNQAADVIGFATAGTERVRIGTVLLIPDGSANPPGLTFITDPDTGMYRSADNTIGFSAGGTQRLSIGAQILIPDGAADSAPGFSFINDANTGIRRTNTDEMSVITGGTARMVIGANGEVLLPAAPATPVANGAYREGVAKGAVKFNVSGTILFDFNVSSITDTGAGNWTVNWDRDFGSADYAAVATVEQGWTGTTAAMLMPHIHAMAAGTTQIVCPRVSDAALTDPVTVHVIAMGNQ